MEEEKIFFLLIYGQKSLPQICLFLTILIRKYFFKSHCNVQGQSCLICQKKFFQRNNKIQVFSILMSGWFPEEEKIWLLT